MYILIIIQANCTSFGKGPRS